MSKPKIAEVTGQIVDLLEPFETAERRRIISASLTLLGDTESTATKSSTSMESASDELQGISNQARIWMKQNDISEEDLQHVFHIADGTVEVIAADIPGKDGKAKTINAYILQGLSSFLVTGVAKFEDKSARALCTKSGCYNAANHVVYIKGVGNRLTGSKDMGWTITTPGLKYGAGLIKELTMMSK